MHCAEWYSRSSSETRCDVMIFSRVNVVGTAATATSPLYVLCIILLGTDEVVKFYLFCVHVFDKMNFHSTLYCTSFIQFVFQRQKKIQISKDAHKAEIKIINNK